jgi:hypothetical protein
MITIRTRQAATIVPGQSIRNSKTGQEGVVRDVRLLMGQPGQLVESPGFGRPMLTFEQEVQIEMVEPPAITEVR